MQPRIFLANLGKYNEGKIVGEWFDLPYDIEEMFARIKVGYFDEEGEYHHGFEEDDILYEEWIILDYEGFPFDVHENTSLEKLNEIAEKLIELEDYQLNAVRELIDHNIIKDPLEAVDKVLEQDGIRFYFNCNSMADVAREYLEDLSEDLGLPDFVVAYFDYERFGKDMEIEGLFIYLGNSIYMEVYD